MQLKVYPGSSIKGHTGVSSALEIPGDKSLSHRAALLASLARGESIIRNFQVSGVTRVMLEALTQLGVNWELDRKVLRINGNGFEGLKNPDRSIYCGNSATTLRMLAGALAAGGVCATLDGSEGLRRRPMGRIIAPLQSMGVPIRSTRDGTAPLVLDERASSRPLAGAQHTLPVASAQVKSCILIAALAADGTTTVIEPGPSRDHTERMLSSMGVQIDSRRVILESGRTAYQTRVTPPESMYLIPRGEVTLPADISAAAFIIIAALITPQADLTLEGVGVNPTRTGLLDALHNMGADLSVDDITNAGGEPVGRITVKASELTGTEIYGDRVVRMIDEFPVFAAAAATANGTTVVRDAVELRHKESDRISLLCAEMQKLGVRIEERVDGFVIHGGNPIRGGCVESHGDHRLAMALAVLGLAAEEPVIIKGADVVAESFPNFPHLLQSLGANIKVEQ